MRKPSNRRQLIKVIAIVWFAYALSACTPQADGVIVQAPTTFPAVLTILPTATPEPVAAATLTLPPPLLSTPTAVPTRTPTFQICSPLKGYSLFQLTDTVSNPYNPPPPGSDAPHQGVDLADRLPDSGIAVAGLPVQAVLTGQVAAVQTDRFPYGSAIWIETPLQDLPGGWQATLPLAEAPSPYDPALTCPVVVQPDWRQPERSLYILYAHLQAAPSLSEGDETACGQVIGAIGQSGNALAPHLHLEMRIGPSNWRPGSMAHYTNDASPEEMGYYGTWRISGIFQRVDPLALIAQQP